MNLALAIGLIWLAFAAGYCLSGMLGIGTREELERENTHLRDETIKLKSQNKALRKDMELKDEQITELEAENIEIYLKSCGR